MNPSEEQKGTSGPPAGDPSPAGSASSGTPDALQPNLTPFQAVSPEPPVQPPDPPPSGPVQAVATRPRRPGGGGKTPPPPPPPPGGGGDDEDEEGMLRMSFLEHLEELRTRIIRALMGVAVAFGLSLFYSNQLWDFVCQPAVGALKTLGYNPQNLVQIEP